ncbi:sugar kinase [Bacillus infantis]|uniref:sugar kinase n=1 Tax=Bacillus infantis TaxID=324767 RepID=UPI000B9A3421|nr:sugar kinase [Bacillus infantis]MCK6208778.1 sugar kinase [Bacillus infantis]OXT16640.1 2-dehydro-3-deoxygluconokinase [Bacillus sp. OG2]
MDVITIGETMVLFTPQTTGLMRYANQFSMTFGGAESNVAIGLTRLGHKAGWISKVGNDEFGKAMLSFISGEGVDTTQVLIDSEAPTGVYFKEPRRANDVRVYYYRKDSAASRLEPGDINEEYLSNANYLHLTGITPALSDNCRELVYEAVAMAKKHGVQVVFDPNLRKKLWPEDQARKVLLDLASKAAIVLPGIAEGEFMFGEKDPVKLGRLFLALGPAVVVLKLGEEGCMVFTKDLQAKVPGFPVDRVIDPVGAGDGFAAGFLSGMLDGLSLEDAATRANAVGAFVTMVDGDVEGLPEKDEILGMLENKFDDVSR